MWRKEAAVCQRICPLTMIDAFDQNAAYTQKSGPAPAVGRLNCRGKQHLATRRGAN
jgi:hypothetical protein